MDLASDISGRLIRANQYNGELPIFCPNCGGAVHHRLGFVRRSHFAHNNANSTATLECENYHPSNNNIQVLNSNSTQNQFGNKPHVLDLGGGFFAFSPADGGSLVWQLPNVGHYLGQSYQFDFIIAGEGIKKTIIGPTITPPRIHLLPQIPLVQISASTATDETTYVLSFLRQQLSVFSRGLNFFKINEHSSRLLGINDELEYGCHYWILTPEEIHPLPEILQNQISAMGKWQEWYVYRINFDIEYHPLLISLTRQFFGKNIIEKQPSLSFISPLPHHIDSDGVYVFNIRDSQLLLKVANAISQYEIIVTGGSEEETEITYLDSDYVSIGAKPVQGQNLDIILNEHIKFTIRFEECPLFTPVGITMSSDNGFFELFDCRFHSTFCFSEERNITFRFPDGKVKQFIINSPIENATYDETGPITVKTKDGIDGGNFGHLLPDRQKLTDDAILGEDQCNKNRHLMNILSSIITPNHYGMIQATSKQQETIGKLVMQRQLPAWVINYINFKL